MTNPEGVFSVPGKDISECIQILVSQNPKLKPYIYQGESTLAPFVSIYLNNQDIRFLEGKTPELTDSDTLEIVASLAGG